MSTREVVIGKLGIRYILDGSRTHSLGMFEVTIPPASPVPPPHSHTHNEECVYVLDGRLRYMVGGEARDLGPGESMHTPKGVVHAFSNPFETTARALIVMSPDIGEQYFVDIAAVVSGGGAPDRQALEAVMTKYGLVLGSPAPSTP